MAQQELIPILTVAPVASPCQTSFHRQGSPAPEPDAALHGSQGLGLQQGRRRRTMGNAPSHPPLVCPPRSCCREQVALAAAQGLKQAQVQPLAGGEVGGRGLRTAGSSVGGGTVGTETVCGRRRRGLRRSWRCPCCPPRRARGSLASRC